VRASGAKPNPSRAQWLRRLALRKRNRVAFVLSGGGPLGALQVGSLKALFEAGIRPDLCVGTSVGALNATFVSFDPTPAGVARLEALWMSLSDNDLFPGARLRASWARMLVKGNRVFDNSGIRNLLESRLGDARFEEAQVPFAVVTTDVDSGKEALFTSGRIVEPLLASTAMPGVYPPVEIGGRLHVDGGVANNVPIAPAVELGATKAYVMDSTSHSHQRRPLTRPLDYLLHAFSLARSQRLDIDREMYAEKVDLVMIPAAPLGFFVPFASLDHTAKLIEMSYEHTRGFLRGEPSRAAVEAAYEPQ
jgi:NTE family protein